MRRHHEPARNAVCRLRPEVSADNVETKIDRRGTSGCGQNSTLIDIQHVCIEGDVGIAGGKGIDITPMRRRLPPRQQSSGGKNGNARAQRHDASPTTAGSLQRGNQWRRDGGGNTAPAGSDDQIGFLQDIKTAIDLDPQTTSGAQRTILYAANGETIPILSHLRSWQTEYLAGDAEFESTEPVIDKSDDMWTAKNRSGGVWHDFDDIWRFSQFQ